MSKSQYILLAVVTVVTLGGAFSQGKMTDRWSNEVSQRLEKFTAKLDGVPPVIGNWASVETPVDEDQFKQSNCHGRVSRTYRNTVTGDEVNVFLVSGKGYHCTIHTPDYCYVAAGYETLQSPEGFSVEVPQVGSAEFLNAIFKKETATETTELRILWSYSEDGKWTAPKLAKYQFGNKPALYKVYLISQIKGARPKLNEDPTVAFAKEFFPAISSPLFQGGPATAGAAPAAEAAPPANG